MRDLGAAGCRVRVAVGGDQSIEAHTPEGIVFFIPFEDVLVADVVAGTGTGIGIGTVLLLEFGI